MYCVPISSVYQVSEISAPCLFKPIPADGYPPFHPPLRKTRSRKEISAPKAKWPIKAAPDRFVTSRSTTTKFNVVPFPSRGCKLKEASTDMGSIAGVPVGPLATENRV